MNEPRDSRDSRETAGPAGQGVSRAELGRRLRSIRQAQGYSLQNIAEQAGLSKSFVSQLELGHTAASLGTLKRICAVLDIPVWALLDDEPDKPGGPGEPGDAPGARDGESGSGSVAIVRHDRRKVRRYPGSDTEISLLTPDLDRKIEVTLSVLQPGEGYGHETYTHRGEEFGLVLSGTYEVTVDGVAYVLEEGDSIYFSSRLPHRTRALGDTPVTTFWAVTPPS
ncbi:helix-turn-helix domain-containing protein [Phytoactinopolyspora halophila]|nr:cupin domain-containing protein [Phytoactinopolyspora halophila]